MITEKPPIGSHSYSVPNLSYLAIPTTVTPPSQPLSSGRRARPVTREAEGGERGERRERGGQGGVTPTERTKHRSVGAIKGLSSSSSSSPKGGYKSPCGADAAVLLVRRDRDRDRGSAGNSTGGEGNGRRGGRGGGEAGNVSLASLQGELRTRMTVTKGGRTGSLPSSPLHTREARSRSNLIHRLEAITHPNLEQDTNSLGASARTRGHG